MAVIVFAAATCHSARDWAEPFAAAIGVPASIFALGWSWKHSGLTLD